MITKVNIRRKQLKPDQVSDASNERPRALRSANKKLISGNFTNGVRTAADCKQYRYEPANCFVNKINHIKGLLHAQRWNLLSHSDILPADLSIDRDPNLNRVIPLSHLVQVWFTLEFSQVLRLALSVCFNGELILNWKNACLFSTNSNFSDTIFSCDKALFRITLFTVVQNPIVWAKNVTVRYKTLHNFRFSQCFMKKKY